MKLFAALMIGVLAVGVVSTGRVAERGIGSIIGIITDILDLSLSIGNIVSNGCIYNKDICKYDTKINQLEKELKPKFKILDDLDLQNEKLYRDMTDILAYNNDLAQQSGNLMYLVVSITRKIGSPNIYGGLAKEFEANTNRLLETYRAEVEAMKKAAITKLTLIAIFDGAKLLYHGLKFAYGKLKKEGIIKVPEIDFPKQIIKQSPAKLALRPITNPRFFKAKQQLNRVKAWWNKPNIRKIRGYVKEAGIIVGSLFSLGVSVAVDVTMANKMAETMRNTYNELMDIKNKIDPQIEMERKSKNDLLAAFSSARKSFSELADVIEVPGVNPSAILRIPNADRLKVEQLKVIDKYAKVTEQLQAMDLNAEIQAEIKISVEFGDDLRRIQYSIKRKGWGDVSNDQILTVIAKLFPSKSSFDGHSLGKYRG